MVAMPKLNGKLKKVQPFAVPAGVIGLFGWMLLEVHNLRVDLTKWSVQQTSMVTLITKVDEDAIERHNEVMGKLATMEKTTTDIYLSSRLLEKDGETFARTIDENRAEIRRCCP
jgi:hypothetical protein